MMKHAMIVAMGALIFSAATAEAQTTTTYDGQYVGRLTQTSGKGCSYAGDVKLPVKDGGFNWKTNNVVSRIVISPEGTISGVSDTMTVKGTASARTLDFDSVGRFNGCFNKWHFDKQ